MSGPSPWTDDRIATLRRLHAEGYSASEIAGELGGFSRNAVIGKINRLRLIGIKTKRPRGKKPKPQFVPRNMEVTRDLDANTPKVNAGGAASEHRAVPPLHLAPKPARKAGPINILDMPAGKIACRRPLWPSDRKPTVPEIMFCGAPTAPGSSYCPACQEVLAPGTVLKRRAA